MCHLPPLLSQAIMDAPWPHHTRACTPCTSATSRCPPASLSSRCSPWQNPSGSLRCSGTPSPNSPLSRNESRGHASACAVKRTFLFLLVSVQGQSVAASALLGAEWRREGPGLAFSLRDTATCLKGGEKVMVLPCTQEPSVIVQRRPALRNWWHALKWVLSSDPADLAGDECGAAAQVQVLWGRTGWLALLHSVWREWSSWGWDVTGRE